MQVFYLLENMRVKASGDKKLEDYDTWIVSIRSGTANDINRLVSIQEDMFSMIKPNTSSDTKAEECSMIYFCKMVFPDISPNIATYGWLDG